MTVVAICIFAISSWAVFSRHFNDGIIAKQCFSFAAIAGFIGMVDPHNAQAAFASLSVFVSGLLYACWRFKFRVFIERPRTRRNHYPEVNHDRPPTP